MNGEKTFTTRSLQAAIYLVSIGAGFPEIEKGDVAQKLLAIGLALQQLLGCTTTFDLDGDVDHPPELKALLDACYRPIKRAVEHYMGDESPLSYVAPPPGRPFAKKDR